jgi:AcrR family transcriptional regulator
MARTGRRRGRGQDTNPPANEGASEADRIIDAMLTLIPTEGWRGLSLAAIAAGAELPILQVYRVFRSKQAILLGLFRRIDEAVLAEPLRPEPDERPRDRLFDLLMRRFDALQPYKRALEVLRRDLPGQPLTALCAGTSLLRSMRWMLEAADIPTGGVRGAMTVRLTSAAYLSAMRVWHRDESSDLARTMAALDARLRRIERWLEPARAARNGAEPIPA